MFCRIAELDVEIPSSGDMEQRCQAYLSKNAGTPDIVIKEEYYRKEAWPTLNLNDMVYMESGVQFYIHLLKHSGLMLHASAVEMDGLAYLFSGPCGAGKSTHTGLWLQEFGSRVRLFNDDKPALRLMDGRWMAYGTPWSGKCGININMKAPVAGICFLQRGDTLIRRLSPEEALGNLLAQTLHRLSEMNMDRLLELCDRLLTEVPVFELQSHAEPACAHLSYETMRRAAEQRG